MRNFLLFLFLLLSGQGIMAQSDFATAVAIAAAEVKTGTVSAGSRNVYFKTLLPADGTVTIYLQGEHKGGSAGSVDFYAFDKDHRQIEVKRTLGGKNITTGEKFKDTVRIYSRAADSIYLLMYQGSSQTFDFSLQYEMLDQSKNDAEPNNSISQAKPIKHNETLQGHIGYVANYVTDRNDYYATLLPTSGTVTVYIEGTHTGGSTGSFDLYAYDKAHRQIQVKRVLGNKNLSLGQKFKDTVRIYSRDADSIYLLVYQSSSQSFSYALRYEVADQNINDAEPNDGFAQAVPIIHQETMYGRIGNISNGITDRNDYYKTLLPATGTVTVYIEGVHTGGSDGAIDFYAFDKQQRQVQVKRTLGGKNIALGEFFRDTVEISSRAADSLYLLIYQSSSQSFDYSIRYEITRQSPDDEEPNNTAAEALPIAPADTVYGRIGYIANNVTDRNDYYRAVLPADGTVTIYVRGTHTGGTTGAFDLYVFDKAQRQIQVKRTLGGKNISLGQQLLDTVRVYSRAADTIYFSVYQSSSQSFDYALSYEVLDQSTNDAEPNNNFSQALPLPHQEVVAGHIGYIANYVTDQNDYYRAILPADGTVTVYIEAMHTGGTAGALDLYVFDKGQRQIAVKRTLGGENINLGERLLDTVRVYSRAADTIYFSVYQGSSQSFSYKLSYEVSDQSKNEPEPNDNFSQALPLAHQEVVAGHIGYIANYVTDRYDYYRTVLPADGTITVYIEAMHTGGPAGALDLYVFDKGQRQIEVKRTLGGKNINLGERLLDTVQVYSRAADTIYFSVYQGSSQSFSYKLSYELTDQSTNDAEPNNDFPQAKPITHGESVAGHIGYVANYVTDRYDYFKTLLPVDGTVTVYIEGTHTGGSSGSIDFYVYDKSRRQIEVKRALGGKNIGYGQTFRDTIEIASRAADSLYLLVYQGSSQSFSYKLRYTMPDALTGDPEPNNTFEEALPFSIKDTLNGLLGYVASNVTDRYDYYKTGIPEKSGITVYIEGLHTGGSNGSFSFYAYDKNKRQIGSKAIVGKAVASGEIVRDTIIVNCNNTDSLYITLYQNSSRSFTYNVRFEVKDNAPVAKFSYTRTGNEFGFVNESKNVNNVLWRLGNNQTSTVNYPMQELKPGFYNVQLIATNTVCNFKDTASKEVTVSGIEYFTPTEAGIGGDLNMTIFGGGLGVNTKVTLVGNGAVLHTIDKFDHEKGQQLGVVFDLHSVKTGVYDLHIQFPNEEPIVYQKAFTINEMEYPETWSEITGPAIWRTGRTANFNLVVGSRGNTTARGAIVAMAWPKNVNVEWIGEEYKPDPAEFTEVVMDDGEVIRTKNEVVQWLYDLNTTIPIDTFGYEPFDGYVRFFTIPALPAGSTYELPFRSSSEGSGLHTFKTYTIKPNQFGSCETFNIKSALTGPQGVELAINTLDIIVDEIKVPPITKIPAQVAVKTLKVTQKHIDVSGKVLFHRMWARYYGADDLQGTEYYDYYKEGLAADEFAINQMKDIAFDQAINLGTGAALSKRKNQITDQMHTSNQAMLNHKAKQAEYMAKPKKGTSKARRAELKKMSREEARKWEEAFKSGENTIDELRNLDVLEDMLEGAKDAKTYLGELELLIKYVEENCPEHKEQLEKLKEKLGKEEDIIEQREKDSETRTSYDPNAIYGPSGFKSARYVNGKDRQSFVIVFENVDTAKADAQIVKILDTLDKSKFDLATFEFGNVTVGKKQFRVPKGRKQFMMERSLAPDLNMKVRINASLDTATGILQWQFTSIDPQTGDLPEYFGFLPPNVDYPSGEGSVSYTVKPVKNLVDGTQLLSRAAIIFDTNEPIATNTWKNTIDADNPRGHISAKIYEDTLIVLEYGSTDAGSGVDYYHLYMSEDNGVWVPIAGGNGDSILLLGEAGKTYRFYMEAQDKTGNREKKNAVGEAVVSLPKEINNNQPGNLMLYPIPSNGTINLELDVPETQQLVISVYSASGQRVAELYNGNANSGNLKITKNLYNLSSGLYFVHARGNKGINQKRKLVLVK